MVLLCHSSECGCFVCNTGGVPLVLPFGCKDSCNNPNENDTKAERTDEVLPSAGCLPLAATLMGGMHFGVLYAPPQ